MEVATGILYLDATLDDGELDQPELACACAPWRAHRRGAQAAPSRSRWTSWMEELYRRVSDRQTMGSVVQELRASLSEIEKQIDQYFRNPAERQVLIPVPAQLSSMRGVLSVLGMDQASAAALHMRDDVDALAQTEVDPHQAIQTGTFDRLADNLGALSFLIDMISVQPQLAKSLFRFDPETGSLSAVMGQTGRSLGLRGAGGSPAATLAPSPLPAPAPEPSPAPAPAAMPEPMSTAPLLEQVLSLAEAAARPEVQDGPKSSNWSGSPSWHCWPTSVTWRAAWSGSAGSLRDSPSSGRRASGSSRDADQSGRHRPRRAASRRRPCRHRRRYPPVAPGSKKTRRCARSSSRKRARSSPTPMRRSSAWPTHPTMPAT
jgi:hypothetical protein